MNNSFMFSTTINKLGKKDVAFCKKVAKRYGAKFVHVGGRVPKNELTGWFEAICKGDPFDTALVENVALELTAAGVTL